MMYGELYWNGMKKAVMKVRNLSGFNGKKILITGSNGLICSAVADVLMCAVEEKIIETELYLAGRNEQRFRERFGQFCEKPYIHFVHYNALEPVNFEFQADYIIHGAGNAHPNAYVKEPVETLLGNVQGVHEILSYARKHQCRRVLYISSSEVYGGKEGREPYHEDDYGFIDILNPRACYPSGKRAAETLCACYGAQHGLDVVIVRPGHIYGPTMTRQDSRAFAQFARNVLAGEDIVMKSAGSQLRSYCYTTDCAAAILTVLLEGTSGEAYNISNRDSIVSIRQLAEAFAAASGRQVIFEKASDREQAGYNLMDNSSLNSDKLESLGWQGSYNINEGVVEMLKSMS